MLLRYFDFAVVDYGDVEKFKPGDGLSYSTPIFEWCEFILIGRVGVGARRGVEGEVFLRLVCRPFCVGLGLGVGVVGCCRVKCFADLVGG